MNFRYTVEIVELLPFSDTRPLGTHIGEVEAANHRQAKDKAKILISNHCQKLQDKSGVATGYDFNNVHVEIIEE